MRCKKGRTLRLRASCICLSFSSVFSRPPLPLACSALNSSISLRIASLRSWSGPPRTEVDEILLRRSF